jgi:hypothetical protein
MAKPDRSVLKCTGISCSTGREAQNSALGRQTQFFGYHSTNGHLKSREKFVKPRAETNSTDSRSLQAIAIHAVVEQEVGTADSSHGRLRWGN